MIVFDRRALRRQRMRAAAGFARHDFLIRAGAERLADRLADMRPQFGRVLELGAHGAILRAHLPAQVGAQFYVAAGTAAPSHTIMFW